MDTVVIGAAFVGSFAGAFVIQKLALESLLRFITAERRNRE
jgi:hypothetical protein